MSASDRSGGGAAEAHWSGRSEAEWADHLRVPHLELHGEIPSTNDRLRVLSKNGADPFTTVIADTQTAGRGREGKSWHSPPRSGLWISILLPLGQSGHVGVLPLAVGVALARTVERLCGIDVELKWPNDLVAGGRKIAGILCESAGETGVASPAMVAVGIGVNVRAPSGGVPGDLGTTAGFLESLADRAVEEPELAAALLADLRRWTIPAPKLLAGPLRSEWEARDRLRGRRVRIDSGVTGVSEGVSPEGALRVRMEEDRVLSVRSGSVRLETVPTEPPIQGGE